MDFSRFKKVQTFKKGLKKEAYLILLSTKKACSMIFEAGF